MNTRAAKRLAWSLWGLFFLFEAAGLALRAINARPLVTGDTAQLLAMGAVTTVGAIVAANRPHNPLGWIYLFLGLFVLLVGFLLNEYGWYATIGHPGTFGGAFAEWVGNWAWIPPLGLFFTFGFLLFPDGHLPSPRWRPVAWASAIVIVLWSVTGALASKDYTHVDNTAMVNPFSPRTLTPLFDTATQVFGLVFILLVGVSVASLVVRFRRGSRDEREQLKWPIFAGAINTIFIALPLDHGSGGAVDAVFGVLIALIPVAAGIAILKYRLYDIDVVISKTVVYGALAAFITTVYVVIVWGIGRIVGASGVNPALSVAATAIVAVAFQPVRLRAGRLANRLVYGKRATPYEVLSEFSERLAGAYAADDLLPRMARILAEGTGAFRADVWLLVGGRLRPEATWPSEAERRTPVSADRLPEDLVPVRHTGELLGALSVEKKPGDVLTPTEQKLVADLASQAGLVLRNVALIEDLRASRQRLVAAQDEERRKIERNLHDGAQQQLVALAVRLKLAEQSLGTNADRERELLATLGSQANDALENLRDLARGIYPPLLADQGLPAALEAQARNATVPTTIESDGVGRYPQEIEAAVYFSCLEALQNVAKYAKASRAVARLSDGGGELRFQVEDDGEGFDPAETDYGTGLQGMADRLAAIGGRVDVRSAPGAGTSVTGSVPLEVQR